MNGNAITAGQKSALVIRQMRGDCGTMTCRPGCGACCIAPSISTLGKPAGEPCVHLTPDYRCTLFGSSRRPSCCSGLQPSIEMCGSDREAALAWLTQLEADTAAC